MKKLILLVCFVAVSLCGSAQGLVEVRDSLAIADSLSGARVVVSEMPDAALLINDLLQAEPRSKVYGYRVGIFSDNRQSARSEAFAVAAQFSEIYPEIPARVSGDENPYWKVIVGQCATDEEAIALWGKVQQNFPKAFLTRGTINVSELNK